MDFGDAETLTDHKKMHLNRPDFQCIQCERVVSSRKSLKEHMRIHVRTRLSFDLFELSNVLQNYVFEIFLRPVQSLTNATNVVKGSRRPQA